MGSPPNVLHQFLEDSLLDPLKTKPSFLLAFSAGVDSVALGLSFFLDKKKGQQGGKIALAYVNHRIRSEQHIQKDLQIAYQYSELWNFPLFVLEKEGEGEKTDENSLRILRYRLLEECRKKEGYDYLVTAHHLQDQMETILMREGGGWTSWGGIPHRTSTLLRPFLTLSKKEIVRFCQDQDLSYHQDWTNSLLKYQRNKIRHDFLGLWEHTKINLAFGIRARAFRELQSFVDERLKESFVQDDGSWKYPASYYRSLPEPISRRVLTYGLNLIGLGGRIEGSFLEELKDQVQKSPTGLLQKKGSLVYWTSEFLFFRPLVVNKPDIGYFISTGKFLESLKAVLKGLDFKGSDLKLEILKRDNYLQGGVDFNKKVSQLFTQKKVPACLRKHFLGVYDQDGLRCVFSPFFPHKEWMWGDFKLIQGIIEILGIRK